jgi:hypothetical protein
MCSIILTKSFKTSVPKVRGWRPVMTGTKEHTLEPEMQDNNVNPVLPYLG